MKKPVLPAKPAFTLIEVIIAVLIASLACMAVLNLGIGSTKVGERLREKQKIMAPLMIASIHGKKDFSQLDQTLESLLGSSYAIEHDRLKTLLQTTEVFYEEEHDSNYDAISEAVGGDYDLPQFEIVRRSVSLNGVSGRVYLIRRYE